MSEKLGRAGWYERVQKYGKQVVIMEEMVRLGFWPPDTAAAEQREQAQAALAPELEELARLRTELNAVEKEINNSKKVEAQLQEIRRRRIERVRAQREVRKQEKARQQQEHQAADHQRRQERPPFLGHGVSYDLNYEENAENTAKIAALGLPALQNASDIAAAVGVTPGEISWLTYHRGAATIDHYSRFTIPKRSGGLRVISSPKKRLRVAQKWLLEAILQKIEIHEAAMAFRPGRSILDNAKLHQDQAIVIRMDLKDFFPGITFPRVRRLFQKFGYNEGVASLLALLATEAPRAKITLDGQTRFVSLGERQLPQGACTSPALTNILCRNLDARLNGLAKKFGFSYTRYADDCVFSTPDKDARLGAFLKYVRQVFESEGFTVNEEKTRIMRRQQRQAVTGLVVNEAPHISRTDLRNFRSLLHHCETEGTQAVSERLGLNVVSYARGYLAFVAMVSPDKAARFKAEHPWLNH